MKQMVYNTSVVVQSGYYSINIGGSKKNAPSELHPHPMDPIVFYFMILMNFYQK